MIAIKRHFAILKLMFKYSYIRTDANNDYNKIFSTD